MWLILVVKVPLATKRSRTEAEGPSRRVEEQVGDKVLVPLTSVLSMIPIFGPICPTSPSPCAQGQGSPSLALCPADVPASTDVPWLPST